MKQQVRSVGIVLLFMIVFVCQVTGLSDGSSASQVESGTALPQDTADNSSSQIPGNSESNKVPDPAIEKEPGVAETAAESGVADSVVSGDPAEKSAQGEQPADPAGAIDRFARQFDDIPIVRNTSEKILSLTTQLDEFLQIPMFHQIVYSLGIAGAVSFTFQLLLTKLLVLLKGGFSIREIISDLTGLVFSLSVVVLTLRGGGRGIEFARHPGMLVGLTILGILFGLVHYRWAQQQEILAARGQHAGGKRRRSQ
jgi:hypothetical protein